MEANDKAVEGFKAKLTKQGISPAVIQAILAALSALLGGCIAPAPANLKAGIDRPLVQVKLLRQLMAHGVRVGQLGMAQDAATAAVKGSNEDELKALVRANEEVE